MICELCRGLGEVLVNGRGEIVQRLDEAALLVPCPECIGGVASCCDAAGAACSGVGVEGSNRERGEAEA